MHKGACLSIYKGVVSFLILLITVSMASAQGAANPYVISFAVPATHQALTIPIIRFTATDAHAITGYMITESMNPPKVDSTAWTVTPPNQYTFATKGKKTLYAWVKNSTGLVSRPASASTEFVSDEATTKTAVAAGMFHAVALKSDGGITTWGDNYEGQTETPSGLRDIVAIAAGAFHTAALVSDGTVTAWGDNEHGQSTTPSGLKNVVAIAAGSFHTVALKSDGTVVAWGRNNYGQTTVPSGLSNVVAIAANHGYTIALKSNGIVVLWGRRLPTSSDLLSAKRQPGDALQQDHRHACYERSSTLITSNKSFTEWAKIFGAPVAHFSMTRTDALFDGH